MARRLLLQGRVQGLGVRPAVARLARSLHLRGAVRNTNAGVEIHIQGEPADVESFCCGLAAHVPVGTFPAEILTDECEPDGRQGFHILPSVESGRLATPAPPDVVTCAQCTQEVRDSADRRFRYAFTSCTACGPRYSIVDRMPFDRVNTSMNAFAMCAACQGEFDSPSDRRGHSQTNACPQCGPRLILYRADPRGEDESGDVVARAAEVLRVGQILALRGLGGYQLLCDATNAAAVARLRQCKGRADKPFAVMVESLAAAEALAMIGDSERRGLADSAGAIVIVDRRGHSPLAENVAPALRSVGVMLPTTPLHLLLCEAARRPLVVSSGNLEGQPLAYRSEEISFLLNLAAAVIDHDRPIVRPLDDSVVRVIADRAVTLRLGRGLAPMPLHVEISAPLAAVGGEMKAAPALCNGRQSILGPHVGDLGNLATRQRFVEQYHGLCRLYGAAPRAVAHDLHPDYFTTRFARELNLPTVAVQHHHAHVAAAMIEHGWLDRTVLGVAWDGMGYGPDGRVWGGEFLLATPQEFHRAAHLRPFALPGGDQAARQPWRVAVALAVQAIGPDAASRLQFADVPPRHVREVAALALRPRLCPISTSAGRLFDAAAALLLDCNVNAYEGHAAQRLEALADEEEAGCFDIPYCDGVLDWRPMIERLLFDRRQHADPGILAMRFIRTLAEGIVRVCRRHSTTPVVLAGGVFQNRRLVEAVRQRWTDPQPLGLPHAIPPGDGGLAAGQLVVAAARLGLLNPNAGSTGITRERAIVCA